MTNFKSDAIKTSYTGQFLLLYVRKPWGLLGEFKAPIKGTQQHPLVPFEALWPGQHLNAVLICRLVSQATNLTAETLLIFGVSVIKRLLRIRSLL